MSRVNPNISSSRNFSLGKIDDEWYEKENLNIYLFFFRISFLFVAFFFNDLTPSFLRLLISSVKDFPPPFFKLFILLFFNKFQPLLLFYSIH